MKDSHHLDLVRAKDGHWRFAAMPGIALQLGYRLIKRGQKYIQLSPNEKFPLPFPLPKSEARKGGQKSAQLPEEGSGPLFYKRYTVEFSGSKYPGEVIMERIQANPDFFSPKALARYVKTKGEFRNLQVGDEFFIEMTGPWNAPVRVVQMTPLSFTFVTLQDHMEAGEIHFEIIPRRGFMQFQIQSWARSRDAAVDFAYDQVKVAQLIQAEMWTAFSENVVKFSGGRQQSAVEIATQRIPKEKVPADPIKKNKAGKSSAPGRA